MGLPPPRTGENPASRRLSPQLLSDPRVDAFVAINVSEVALMRELVPEGHPPGGLLGEPAVRGLDEDAVPGRGWLAAEVVRPRIRQDQVGPPVLIDVAGCRSAGTEDHDRIFAENVFRRLCEMALPIVAVGMQCAGWRPWIIKGRADQVQVAVTIEVDGDERRERRFEGGLTLPGPLKRVGVPKARPEPDGPILVDDRVVGIAVGQLHAGGVNERSGLARDEIMERVARIVILRPESSTRITTRHTPAPESAYGRPMAGGGTERAIPRFSEARHGARHARDRIRQVFRKNRLPDVASSASGWNCQGQKP